MQQSQQAPFQRKPSQLEETLQNFTKATQSSFDQINKNHEEMSKNQDVSIKNMEMKIGQLSRQITTLPGSSGGFTGNTVDNPKNETCKVVNTDYIKPPFPIIKKKPVQEDESTMFAKFKEMLATLQISISFHEILELMPNFFKFMKALLKGTKGKAFKEHVSMTENDEMVISQDFPPKLKDSAFMPLKTVKDLKVGEIIPSNTILTLADSSLTQSVGILHNVLVHVDGLVFPVDFVVLDTKGDSRGSVILGRPFLVTGKAKIDVETGELILKFNKNKVVSRCMIGHRIMVSKIGCVSRGLSSRAALTPSTPNFPNLKFFSGEHAENFLKLVDYHIMKEKAFD
ncbi:uncharacterized protein LOC127102896 [Lathyrus oleraceus]|uniref:uncharacterized protein LOC127102896 n=1 Tax=Pisum sativum TaxID=3888 RepID=UPI0021CE7CB8|nr:uncharacterized protein LOC127102896 [Pisum sativum]